MDVIQLISSLGFPIVACIYIAIWTSKQNDNYRADIKELQKEHKEEIKQVTEALNNNTLVLQKLCDKLDDDKKGDAA
jgi:predicted DNA-binding ArsR family transcriptional regulator